MLKMLVYFSKFNMDNILSELNAVGSKPMANTYTKKKIYNLHSNEQLEINNLSFIPCLL